MFQPIRALVAQTDISELCELWHRRMAQLHHGAFKMLRDMVIDLPKFNTNHHDVCRVYALGNYTKTPFPSSDNRAIGILDLVHSDVYGLVSHVSLTGCEYYVTFIDNHSKKTWIFFLKTKDKVFKRFQEFKSLVENQTWKKIKVLRLDNGGEYTSIEMKDFCRSAGIKREYIVPYNPKQNGVAERKNKAIVGAARAMLHGQRFPFFLWFKRCNIVVYLHNRSPHKVLGSKTIEEVFTNKKPKVGLIKIFRCLTYSYVPEENKTKWNPLQRRVFLWVIVRPTKPILYIFLHLGKLS